MSQFVLGKFIEQNYCGEIFHDLRFFDSSFAAHVTPRSLGLKHFNGCELREHPGPYYHSSKRTKLFARKLAFKTCFRELKENERRAVTKSIPNENLYFPGDWSHYELISKVANLNSIFKQIDTPFSEEYQKLKMLIHASNSVGVHIRRGDYVNNPLVALNHQVLPIEYYHNSISAITEQVPKRKLFFFSDDINWVKQNLKYEGAVYIDNTTDQFEDFALMRACQHFIVANSTFSWWAATLLSELSPSGKIICPKRSGPTKPENKEHSNWLKLEPWLSN